MNNRIKHPIIVFAAGIVLLAASSIGATRATFTYQSDAQQVDFSTSTLTVALQEERDGKFVDVAEDGQLVFSSLQNDDGKYDFNIGQDYPENVQVVNNSPGGYDEYVRVVVRKSWVKDGVKDTELNPDAIVLDYAAGWIIDDETEEGVVLYYPTPLKAINQDASAKVPVINNIRIDNMIWQYVKTVDKKGEKGTIINEYKYNDEAFLVELRVDAVQAHNGQDAILGAWGADVELSGNTITSVNGSTKKTE